MPFEIVHAVIKLRVRRRQTKRDNIQLKRNIETLIAVTMESLQQDIRIMRRQLLQFGKTSSSDMPQTLDGIKKEVEQLQGQLQPLQQQQMKDIQAKREAAIDSYRQEYDRKHGINARTSVNTTYDYDTIDAGPDMSTK